MVYLSHDEQKFYTATKPLHNLISPVSIGNGSVYLYKGSPLVDTNGAPWVYDTVEEQIGFDGHELNVHAFKNKQDAIAYYKAQDFASQLPGMSGAGIGYELNGYENWTPELSGGHIGHELNGYENWTPELSGGHIGYELSGNPFGEPF